jgi:cell division protein FtsI (penicillin-binding protein 3)
MSSVEPRGRTSSVRRAVRRLHVVGALFLVALGGLWLKSARLQLVLGEDLRGLAADQHERSTRIDGPRGDLVDREGRPLAVSVPSFSIAARPSTVEDKAGVARVLSTALSLPAAELQERLSSRRSFVWLARRVSREQADAVRALGAAGIEITQDSRRYYPNKALFGQLVGGVDVDGVARSGAERAFDAHLKGRDARLSALQDNRGRRLALAADLDVAAQQGDTVELTVDAELQRVAEEALASTVAEFGATAAWAITLDARTAEVLAVANAPAFNPNTPGVDVAYAKNRAFAESYEPGSIFKMITFAAALDAGVVDPAERIFCENGSMRLGKHVIHDTHKAEWLSATEVFKQSSNIGTLKIAQRLGEDRFRDALVRYGLGERAGTGMLDEAAGRLPREQRWGDARLATVSFGHGMLVTTLQMVSFAQAIANDGVRATPRLVRGVRAPDGERIEALAATTGERIMSSETAHRLKQMMRAVTEAGGTGTLARRLRAGGRSGGGDRGGHRRAARQRLRWGGRRPGMARHHRARAGDARPDGGTGP